MDNPKEKKYIVLPHSAYTKSLNAFKQGMQDGAEPKPKSRGAYIASSLGAAVTRIYYFYFLPITDNQEQPADEENQVEKVEEVNEEKAVDLDEIGVNEELLSEVVERDQFETGDSWGDVQFHYNELLTFAPSDWRLTNYDDEFSDGSKAVITGFGGILQTILVFEETASPEEVDRARKELISDVLYTQATEVPINRLEELVEEKDGLNLWHSKYKDRFAIELDDEAKMFTLLNEKEGRLYDYVEANLFGKKLILLTDVGIDQSNKRALTYFTLGTISPADDGVVSKGPYENKYGRPESLTMVTGIWEYEFTDLNLYEHELGFTSYVEEGTDLEKIERNGFTEWKFINDHSKDNRYYSFGKLDPAIPIENAKETLINGYELDPKNVEGSSQVSFSHSIGRDTSNEIVRSFELVQKQGEWYYTYTQEDYSTGFKGPSHHALVSKFQQEIMFH